MHRHVLIFAACFLAPGVLRAQDEDKDPYKSSYRIINVHRHCDQPSEDVMRAEMKVMDRVGVSAVVILDGGTTDGKLPRWLALRKTFPGRLIVFSNVAFGRVKQKTFFEDIVAEVTAQHRMGAQGVKI